MSQIFEALRRSRGKEQRKGRSEHTARADAILTSMGFPTEESARTRRRPLRDVLLVILIAALGWAAWSFYPVVRTSQDPVAAISADGDRRTTAAARRPVAVAADTPPRGNAGAEAAPPAAAQTANVPAVPPQQRAVSDRRPPSAGRVLRRSRGADDFRLALYYQRAGDFENALMHYRAVIQADQLNARAHNNLGLLYRDKGLLDEAVRHFERSLLIDDAYTAARNNLGVALLAQSRVDEAVVQLRRVLRQDSRNLEAMVNLALAEKTGGRPGAAIETLLGAITRDPGYAPAHYNLAVIYEQSGDVSRAIAHYRTFLEHAEPHHAARIPDVRARLAELTGRTLPGAGGESPHPDAPIEF